MTKEPRTYNGEIIVCSISGVGKTGQPHGKIIKLDPYLTPYTKSTQNGLKT